MNLLYYTVSHQMGIQLKFQRVPSPKLERGIIYHDKKRALLRFIPQVI